MKTTTWRCTTWIGTLIAAAGAMGLVIAPASAQDVVQHSGAITAVDGAQETIAIEEMGPWHGPSTGPARVEVRLTPATTITIVERANRPGGFAGAFSERTISTRDIRPGDWANVTMKRDAGRLTATSVVIVRPDAGAFRARVEPRV